MGNCGAIEDKYTFDQNIQSNAYVVVTAYNSTTHDYGNSIGETYADEYPEASFYTVNLDVVPEVQTETGLQSVPTILIYSIAPGAHGGTTLRMLTYNEAGDVAASLKEIFDPQQ